MSAPVTRCVRCRQQRCVCDHIPQVVTRTRFLIVRHRAERSRVSNSGHFAALAIAGCEIVEWGGRDPAFDQTRLPLGDGAMLLFPGGAAAPPARPPERIIVLDGSWPQARHMRQRIAALRGVPVLTLPPPDPERRRLRRMTHAYGMTTLEAIAGAVALFEGAELAEPLERLHDVIAGMNSLSSGGIQRVSR